VKKKHVLAQPYFSPAAGREERKKAKLIESVSSTMTKRGNRLREKGAEASRPCPRRRRELKERFDSSLGKSEEEGRDQIERRIDMRKAKKGERVGGN